MTDLFGNDTPPPKLKAAPEPVAADLFQHTVEAAALASGRPASQERSELLAPEPEPASGLFSIAIRTDADLAPGTIVLATPEDYVRAKTAAAAGQPVPPDVARRIGAIVGLFT